MLNRLFTNKTAKITTEKLAKIGAGAFSFGAQFVLQQTADRMLQGKNNNPTTASPTISFKKR